MLHTQNVDVFHVSWFWSLYIHQLIGKGNRHFIYQWEWSPVKRIIFVSWSLDCKVLELKKQIIYIVLMSANSNMPFLAGRYSASWKALAVEDLGRFISGLTGDCSMQYHFQSCYNFLILYFFFVLLKQFWIWDILFLVNFLSLILTS